MELFAVSGPSCVTPGTTRTVQNRLRMGRNWGHQRAGVAPETNTATATNTATQLQPVLGPWPGMPFTAQNRKIRLALSKRAL